MMTLFKPAENTTAYLKMALLGFQGSGKTYTATTVAVGLVQMMRELGLPAGSKPIAFLDTENGSDWVRPRINAGGVELVTAKTRAFTDLLAAVPEAESSASVLLIDSLTHFWVELCETYYARKAREYKRESYRLQFQDWAFLKAEWRKFTDRFVNSSVHIIACGRAGFEYDYQTDGETEKKSLVKTGIKMKAEGEMGYEPDLLVLMERRMNMATKADEHIAHVLKDRSTLLDGREFAEPTFESFLPHIRCLNLGGRQLGVDTTRTSASLIPADARDSRVVQRKIVLDEIESLLVLHFPSTSGADKKKKLELLRTHFKACWAEIESVTPLFDLRAGYDSLHRELEGVPSRYGAPPPVTDDGIPEFLDRRKPNGAATPMEPSYVDLVSE
jgi:hypothetical protein